MIPLVWTTHQHISTCLTDLNTRDVTVLHVFLHLLSVCSVCHILTDSKFTALMSQRADEIHVPEALGTCDLCALKKLQICNLLPQRRRWNSWGWFVRFTCQLGKVNTPSHPSFICRSVREKQAQWHHMKKTQRSESVEKLMKPVWSRRKTTVTLTDCLEQQTRQATLESRDEKVPCWQKLGPSSSVMW